MDTILMDTALGPFMVYETGTITRALQEGQWWDDHLKPILDEATPGLAIDIGAHFGWFTVYLAQQHQQVIAVEPFPSSFALLQRNLHRRPELIEKVQLWPVAAYNQAVTLSYDRESDTTDPAAFGFTTREGGKLPVAGIPLDLYLPAFPPVTVIKCDAQGADLRALKGMEMTIRRCRPLIVFEWEEGMAAWQGDTWKDYEEFFERIDYSMERITPHYWDCVARPR